MTRRCTTALVMGSLPRGDTGVGPATNGTFMQVGGALGVAVIGSLLAARYQDRMTSTLAPYHLPAGVEHTILGSVGGALAIAERAGGTAGALLAHAARAAFVSGMDLGLLTGAVVGLAGALVALAAPPRRPGAGTGDPPSVEGSARPGMGKDPGEVQPAGHPASGRTMEPSESTTEKEREEVRT